MVLIIEGHKAQDDELPADAAYAGAVVAELPLKQAAALAAETTEKKNALYKYALLEQQGNKPAAGFAGWRLRLPGLLIGTSV